MADIVERLDLLAIGTVRCWAATYANVWQRACAHDCLDPAAPFVVFSTSNPFAPYVDHAYRKWAEAVAGNRQVGYVGLVIEGGKAKVPDNIVREGRRLLREEQRAKSRKR